MLSKQIILFFGIIWPCRGGGKLYPDHITSHNSIVNWKRVSVPVCIVVKIEPTEPDITEAVHIAVPDEKAFLIRSLLNYDAPHYFARFAIAGCPPGLEVLDKYEHLLINRRLRNAMADLDSQKELEAFCQFDVKTSRGIQLYLAIEDIENPSVLKWTRDARTFNITFYDFHCRKAFTIRRNCSLSFFFAQYLCLFSTFGFQGCGNNVDVFLADGSLLGSIKQKLSFSSIIFYIYNMKGNCTMIVQGIITDGIMDVHFPDDDEPIAMIETLMDPTEALDYYKVSVPRFSMSSGITFFKNFITPEQKALLMSTAILLDYMFLDPTSDYPHWVQVIPDDFRLYGAPTGSLYRDGSKEILIQTETELKYDRATRRRLRGKWSCCVWCAHLCCICCFLGLRRNAVRFIFFTVGVIVAVIVLVAFINGFKEFLANI